MWQILKYISVYKTLRFNFYYLPFKVALKFPILVSRSTLVSNLKGNMLLEGTIKIGIIRLGFGNVPVFDRIKSRSVWNVVKGGLIVFKGNATLGHGSKIGCGGKLIFGNNFQITAESLIVCDREIVFGDDVLVSWKCQIMDTDFHKILSNGKTMNPNGKIKIGNKVWIGSHVIINKGVVIPSNSVIASSTILRGRYKEENTLIGGNPAVILWNNINWE